VNAIDGPTKLVRQDAILGGLSIGQFTQRHNAQVDNIILDHSEDSIICVSLATHRCNAFDVICSLAFTRASDVITVSIVLSIFQLQNHLPTKCLCIKCLVVSVVDDDHVVQLGEEALEGGLWLPRHVGMVPTALGRPQERVTLVILLAKHQQHLTGNNMEISSLPTV